MKEKIEKYVEEHLKEYELEGVEIVEEDIDYIEKLVNAGKTIEEASDKIMLSIRDCLDAGLEETEDELDDLACISKE